MTTASLYSILSGLKIPVAYRFFIGKQDPPFICFYTEGTDNEFADNSVYKGVSRWVVELYTETKEPATEASVEAVLPPWNKNETYIEDEHMLLISYEFEAVDG